MKIHSNMNVVKAFPKLDMELTELETLELIQKLTESLAHKQRRKLEIGVYSCQTEMVSEQDKEQPGSMTIYITANKD